MLYNVPQFVDIEDKVAGPLTWKQLFWMIGMGIVLLIVWNIFEFGYFVMIAIPVAIIFAALAFYRPHGQPLIKMIFYGITFLFRPKLYTWYRLAHPRKRSIEEKTPEKKRDTDVPVITLDEITNMANQLDDPKEVLTRSQRDDMMK